MWEMFGAWWPWSGMETIGGLERQITAHGAEIEELRAENARLQEAMDRVLEEAKKVCQQNWDLRDKGAKDALRADKAEKQNRELTLCCQNIWHNFTDGFDLARKKFDEAIKALNVQARRESDRFVEALKTTGVEIREESPC